jgi:crotonobetainyl-CoA hydratase
MSDAPAVLVEHRGHTMIITFNRPDARNAVNVDLATITADALEEANHDSDVWVVVITGAGDKAFCAGADLKAIARGEKITRPDYVKWGFGGIVKHPITKPIIAAVNGPALGGGTEIALSCDLVIAADTATFGLPEVKRGFFAAAGGVFRIVQQVPRKRAMELILTGNAISAEEALELGLVNKVVPAASVLDEALALADRICVNAPLAVQACKRVAVGLIDGVIQDDVALWELNDSEYHPIMTTEDAKEGPRAFAEKRQPVWQAR